MALEEKMEDGALEMLLEHLFSPLASKNSFYSRFWLTAGVALTY